MAKARAIPSLGGYDEEFVNAVEEDWQCAICQLPLKDPMLTKCGHRFCRQCLDEHFRRLEIDGQQLSCPVDRNILIQNKDTFPDKATERKILSLVIKCPNNDCDWTGELRSKEKHLASCPPSISCPYADMGCEKKIQRRDIDSHLQSAMRLHLDLACLKLIDTQVQLKDTQVQLSKTQEEFKETTRKLEEKFNSSQKEFKEIKRQLEKKVTFLEKMMQCSEEHNYFQWKISGFSEALKKAKINKKLAISSDPFYRYGYKCSLHLCPNGRSSGLNTHIAISFAIMKGNYDDILPWPFHKKVTITVIDQQENSFDRENIVSFFTTDPENDPKERKCFAKPVTDMNTTRGIGNFVSHQKLSERCYIVDDTILIQVEIAPPQ